MGDDWDIDTGLRVAQLEEEMNLVRRFFTTRTANIVASKKLLDTAARRNQMKSVMLSEESDNLDTQRKLFEDEELIMRDFMELMKRNAAALVEHVAEDQRRTMGEIPEVTTTTDANNVVVVQAEAELPDAPIWFTKGKTEKEDIAESVVVTALTGNGTETKSQIPAFPDPEKVSIPILADNSEGEVPGLGPEELIKEAPPASGEKRSSRGRLIKPKYKAKSAEDWILSSSRITPTKSKSPVCGTGTQQVKESSTDSKALKVLLLRLNEATENAEVDPLLESPNPSANETIADVGIPVIPPEIDDEDEDLKAVAEQPHSSKETKPLERHASPVRHSTRKMKQKEPSPHAESESEITTDVSDSDSQSSPKKLRVKKLAARNIQVYIPYRRLPQLRQRTPVPASPDKTALKEVKWESHSAKTKSKRRRIPQKCSYCPKWFNTPHGRAYHELNHTGEKPHKCEFCNRAFVQKALLKRHMFIHSNEPREKKHQCKVCTSSFAIKYDLVLHSKRHDPQSHQECGVCKKKYSDARYFKKHVAGCTAEARNLKCPYCYREYSIRTLFEKHLEVCLPDADFFETWKKLGNTDLTAT